MDFTIIAIIVLLVIISYFLFFHNKISRKEVRNGYYLKRYLKNKEQVLHYYAKLENLINQHQFQDKLVFDDNEITFSEYLISIETFLKEEYAADILNKLKRTKLTTVEKQEFSKKLLNQSEKLYMLENEFHFIKNKFN